MCNGARSAPLAIYCRIPTYFGIGVLLHFSDKSNKENSPIAFRAFTALGNKSQNDKVVFYKENPKRPLRDLKQSVLRIFSQNICAHN